MIKVGRTGNTYGMASSEYLVTFPNGVTTTIWSPPWNDFTPEEEDANALDYATELWEKENTNGTTN
jgi:hypothetical protein